jgi:2-polyprenyl-3-methyl-5-hydroxy-6-metoxy-1,4-benzoquinol methylase
MNDKRAKKILQEVKKSYLDVALRFSETRKKANWGETDIFAKYVKEGDMVLDLGCGNGRLYGFLKDRSIDYTGIDNSEELINLAKDEWGESEKHRFLFNDILDFKDAKKYDVIFLVAVLHHIPGKKLRSEVVSKIGKYLKEDGVLIMTNWNLFQEKYIFYIIKNIFLKIILKSKLDFLDALIPWKNFKTREVDARRYVHAFTLGELESLVKDNNLKIIENFYSNRGNKTHFWNAWNLVTIAKK